jgi:hypothetical protein
VGLVGRLFLAHFKQGFNRMGCVAPATDQLFGATCTAIVKNICLRTIQKLDRELGAELKKIIQGRPSKKQRSYFQHTSLKIKCKKNYRSEESKISGFH